MYLGSYSYYRKAWELAKYVMISIFSITKVSVGSPVATTNCTCFAILQSPTLKQYGCTKIAIIFSFM